MSDSRPNSSPPPILPPVELPALPEPLAADARLALERIEAAVERQGLESAALAAAGEGLGRVCACSEVVARGLAQAPALLADLVDGGDLLAAYPADGYGERLARWLPDGPLDDAAMMASLRSFRRREMVRIAWRDLAGWAGTAQTLAELSALADACVRAAVDYQTARLVERHGRPLDGAGRSQGLVVLGMGKLGGGELNFSSDIDLVLAFPEEGQTDGVRPLANSQFFARLGQGLLKLLGEVTADGFVFRVDLRLRPWGDAGPLAISFDALENYYQLHGREWERYAMLKARVVAGDPERGDELLRTLRPFVYRRYLDYNAFASLREMKALIVEQVKRKGLEGNVKLGPGGIREIEFIAQAFQLIRGGRESALQERSLLTVLPRLAEAGCLPAAVVEELVAAYLYLRRVENRLQMAGDQQTHSLPGDERGRLRLAYAMGCDGWEELERTLEHHRSIVQRHFNAVFSIDQQAEDDDEAIAQDPQWRVWHQLESESQSLRQLAEVGYPDPAAALERLRALRGGATFRVLSETGQQHLDRLVPMVVAQAGSTDNPNDTLERLLHLLETVARRTVYLTLLVESSEALAQLVRLCSASPWIANLLTRHPILLDELIDPRTLFDPPSRDALERDLAGRLAGVDPEDIELQMDVLRQFKQAAVLRVAAADITEHLPLMRVSDHLTAIAEIVLAQVVRLAEDHLAVRHGRPYCEVDGARRACSFIVVGYGKLGGIELGYGSDLDLVFIHDSGGRREQTDGERELENSVYYARLAQRIIHLLTTLTSAGILYEVDMRLRPDGAAGLMVVGMDAFAKYQRSKAWTWEHQALVRARPVAGPQPLRDRFDALRLELLTVERDRDTLRQEVRDMRARMREHLGESDPGRFHLKQDAGGIADIEFMVQYAALAWAADRPELVRYSDNIRQLEALADCGILNEGSAELLADAYRAFRSRIHQTALQEQRPVVAADEYAELRAGVQRVWRELME